MIKVKFSNLKIKSNGQNNNMKSISSHTNHPLLKSLNTIFDKNLSLLYLSKDEKKGFIPRPIISFRSARKINICLIRAKLYPLEVHLSVRVNEAESGITQKLIHLLVLTSKVT